MGIETILIVLGAIIVIALAVTGALYLFATLTPVAVPSFRQMERKPLAAA